MWGRSTIESEVVWNIDQGRHGVRAGWVALVVALFAVLLPRPSGAESRTLILIDASASMASPRDGYSLMEYARAAVTAALDQVPDGSLVALRAFGHRVPETDVAESCADTELLIPFAPIDRLGLSAAVKALKPRGRTPTGASLRAAARDFPADPSGSRAIILLSDGQDSCGENPADVAAELRRSGFTVAVHTVGLGVFGRGERELRDLARVTGGSFHPVGTPTELTVALLRSLESSLGHLEPLRGDLGGAEDAGEGGGAALPIGAGTNRGNWLGRSDLVDTFSWRGPPGEKFTVSVGAPAPALPLAVQVRTAAGELLATGVPDGGRITADVLEPPTRGGALIEVSVPPGTTRSEYELEIRALSGLGGP